MTIKNLTSPSLLNRLRQAVYSTILIPIFGLAFLFLIDLFDANHSLFLTLNHLSQYTGQWLWANITLFGDPVVILCIALALYRWIPPISFAVLPTLLIGGMTVFYFKWLFAVVRPPGVLENIIVIGQAPVSGAFPSGHSTGAFAFATLLMLSTSKSYLKILFFCLALLVAISRNAVGVHWPLDVSAGIVLGWLCAVLGVLISKNWQNDNQKSRIINSLLFVSAFYLLFRNTGYEQAYLTQALIAIVGLLLAALNLYKVKRPQTTD